MSNPHGLITRAHAGGNTDPQCSSKEKTLAEKRIPRIEWQPWFVGPNGPVKRPPVENLPRTFESDGQIAFLEFRQEDDAGDATCQIRRADYVGSRFAVLPLQRDGARCQVVIGNPDQRELIAVEIHIGNSRQFCRFRITNLARYAESLQRLKTGRDFNPRRDEFLVMAGSGSMFDPALPFNTTAPRGQRSPERELLRVFEPDAAQRIMTESARALRNRRAL